MSIGPFIRNFREVGERRLAQAEAWIARQPFSGRAPKWVAIATLIFLCFPVFYSLGAGDLQDWDECLYAWRAKIIHFFGGAYWLDQSEFAYPGGVGDEATKIQLQNPGFYSGCFPPLVVWLMALDFKIFGISSAAARFWQALMGAGTIFCAYIAVRRLSKNQWMGFWTAFVLGTTLYFLENCRKAQFDGPQTFFVALTITLYIVWQDERKLKWLIAAGAAQGLGLMSKIVTPGMASLFIAIIALYHVYALHSERWRKGFLIVLALGILGLFRTPVILLGLLALLYAFVLIRDRKAALAYLAEMAIFGGAALVVFLPWHLYMTLKHGKLFWDWYIGFHIINRSQATLDGHGHRWYYYIFYLAKYLSAPAFVMLPLGIACGAGWIWKLSRNVVQSASAVSPSDGTAPSSSLPAHSPIAEAPVSYGLWRSVDWTRYASCYLLPAVWMLVPFIIFSVAPTRRKIYLLPLYPAFAMLVAFGFFEVARFAGRRSWKAYLTLFLMVAAIIAQEAFRRFVKSAGEFADDEPNRWALLASAKALWQVITPALAGGAAITLIVALVLGGGRLARVVIAIVIGATMVYQGAHPWRVLLKGKGKQYLGWQQAEAVINNRKGYDLLVSAHFVRTPAMCYYTDGLLGPQKPCNPHGIKSLRLDLCSPGAEQRVARLPKDKRILMIVPAGVVKYALDKPTYDRIRSQFTRKSAPPKTPDQRKEWDTTGDYIETWFKEP